MAEIQLEYIISKTARQKITQVNTQECKKIADE
jgi:hypothetical protein